MAMAFLCFGRKPKGARSEPKEEHYMDHLDHLLSILTRAKTLHPRDQFEFTIGGNDLIPAAFVWRTPAREVFIAGTFDNWKSKIPLIKSHGEFYVILHVPKGTYQFLYCIDGLWRTDPTQKVMIENVQPRNVRKVRSDYRTYRALAIDGKKVDEYKNLEYNQTIPPDEPKKPPPLVPGQMLQIILNKDTPPDIDPILLPRPGHIMLNHLYVMTSRETSAEEWDIYPENGYHTITRFRKVFVATVYYF